MATEFVRPTSSETIETLNRRVSVRQYRDEAVKPEVLDAVLAAACRAPTSSNIQSYSVIVVRDPATKAALAVPAGNQQHIITCPVFLAFCADLTRIEHAMAERGHGIENNNLEMGLVASIDAALVGMAAYVAADSVGLKGVMIGAARNQPDAFARILGLPHRVYCVFGLCLGYVDDVPAQKPRMQPALTVHHEHYQGGASPRQVAEYDAALANHYRGEGRPTNSASWSHDVTEKFKVRPRDTLRDTLAAMGFDFA